MPRPMPPFLLCLAFLPALAACSEAAAPSEGEPAGESSPVVGLYERAGIPDEPSRLCIKSDGGDLRFGLKSSWEGPENCMMKGAIRQAGSALTFVIDGNPQCTLTGRVSGNALTLATPEGAECSYYCGRNTDLGQGAFAKAGSSASDVAKAVDLVGDPLC